MYRVWYSTESFADFVINHTVLKGKAPEKCIIYESDASKPNRFYTMPDHLRKILYLDAPDLIVEKDGEPVFTIETTTEAGTGHNSFQRFSRLAASAENEVPALYIYPEAKVISRQGEGGAKRSWDAINPMVFRALDKVMRIYSIPALLFYFPSNYEGSRNVSLAIPHGSDGLIYDPRISEYAGCPSACEKETLALFDIINTIVSETEKTSVLTARKNLLNKRPISNRIEWMHKECTHKMDAASRSENKMSPLSATVEINTSTLIDYLAQYESKDYQIGSLLRDRERTLLYKVNAKFRGDPYPGALAALDYLVCREGKTYEDRDINLVLVFGLIDENLLPEKLVINQSKGVSVNDFCTEVANSLDKSLLGKKYADLKAHEIPRYYMQVRYGSTYSKAKHIRVYSHFADAILFPDGALWKDA